MPEEPQALAENSAPVQTQTPAVEQHPCKECDYVAPNRMKLGGHVRGHQLNKARLAKLAKAKEAAEKPAVTVIDPPASPPISPAKPAGDGVVRFEPTPTSQSLTPAQAEAMRQEQYMRQQQALLAARNQQAQQQMQYQQQPQQQQNPLMDLAFVAQAFLRDLMAERKAAKAGPDPFSILGQQAFTMYLGNFSKEAGKATGKAITKEREQPASTQDINEGLSQKMIELLPDLMKNPKVKEQILREIAPQVVGQTMQNTATQMVPVPAAEHTPKVQEHE